MKKILSYSLFGNNRKHLNGAITNALLSKNIFPDWDVIYYIWDKYPHSDLEKVIETCKVINNRIIFKEINFSEEDDFIKSLNPKMLRFLIHDDKQYDIYWIRDIDVMLTYRSRQVIDYILANSNNFNIATINDYENLYGYWSASDFIGRSHTLFNMKNKLREYFNQYTNYYNVIKKTLNLDVLNSNILYLIHKQVLFKDSGSICKEKKELEMSLYGIDEQFLRWLIDIYKKEFIHFFADDTLTDQLVKDNVISKKLDVPRLENDKRMEETTYYYDIVLF